MQLMSILHSCLFLSTVMLYKCIRPTLNINVLLSYPRLYMFYCKVCKMLYVYSLIPTLSNTEPVANVYLRRIVMNIINSGLRITM